MRYRERQDMQAFPELFAEDAAFVKVAAMWWKGRDEIRTGALKNHPSCSGSILTMPGIAVRFITPDVAAAHSRWRLEDHVNEAEEALRETGS